MSTLLGIDTGGTFTDAVIMDDEHNILGTAKSPTTKHDLTIGIRNVIEAVLPKAKTDIQLVSLSTTLATNAIVEGQGSPVCLLLLGYDPDFLDGENFERIRTKNTIVHIGGGHNLKGDEQAPLDVKALKEAIVSNASKVSAFAISGYFGVLNPTHELEAKKMVRELTGLPVTCGHELTSNLNAPVRAVTTALNARLIFLMQKLILSVKSVMEHCQIEAPLMIVKGDGSLIGANMALERPIETIMSGPAASVVGAQHLTECDNAFVVDMGGTTTDIAVLKNGRPVINESGSYVDGFRAMVRAVDTCTEGLGGDSEISFDDRNEIAIGPRRVVPLCHLAQEHPSILETLKQQNKLAEIENDDDYGRFLLKQSIFTDKQTGLTSRHREILASLDEGPTALSHLTSKAKYLSIYMDCISDLVDRGLVIFSSFTPTDASNVLGSYDHGSVEASSLGAALSARRTDTEVDEFCRQIRSQVSRLLAHEVINSALYDEGIVNKSDLNGNNLFMVKRALRNNSLHNFSVSLTMNRPLVAIGAPVETYMPRTASLLNGDFVIPEHAEVANAIGAVSGGILQMVKILIKPLDEGRIFRVFLPEGVTDFRDYDKALQLARKTAGAEAEKYALQAGAKEVKTQLSVDENFLKAKRENETVEILFESEISATAFGRPHLGK